MRHRERLRGRDLGGEQASDAERCRVRLEVVDDGLLESWSCRVGHRRHRVARRRQLGDHRRCRAADAARVGHDDDSIGLRRIRGDRRRRGGRGRRGDGRRGGRHRRGDGGRRCAAAEHVARYRDVVGDRAEDDEPGEHGDRCCREHHDGRDRRTGVAELGLTSRAALAAARRGGVDLRVHRRSHLTTNGEWGVAIAASSPRASCARR